MGCKTKAQISMEFLMVIAITFLLVIPLIALFMKESQSTSEQVTAAQVSQIARRIVSSAEAVYAFGEPATVLLTIYFPAGINTSIVRNNELEFLINGGAGLVSIQEPASMNLTGAINVFPGVHSIKVTASNNSVVISEVSR